TAGSGATIRVYFEKYLKDETKFDSDVSSVLAPLVATINRVTDIQKVTQKTKPDVIT
ncbi:MAG: Phosphoglucomutase, partial [Streblomastix strix]